MREVWEDIKGFEGLYQISNFGNVKSFYKDKILKGRPDKDGYYRVCFYKNKKSKEMKIHRLVAQAFIPNPENFPQVNHIDGNKLNNCVSNLEWCTAKYNINHACKLGLFENNRKKASEWSKKNAFKNHNKVLEMYTVDGTFVGIFHSAQQIGRLFNLNPNKIYLVSNNKIESYNGYTFKKVVA